MKIKKTEWYETVVLAELYENCFICNKWLGRWGGTASCIQHGGSGDDRSWYHYFGVCNGIKQNCIDNIFNSRRNKFKE